MSVDPRSVDATNPTNRACLESVLETLRGCKGVLAVQTLDHELRRQVLETEAKVEDRMAYGMCKTINRGVREALAKKYAVALIIDSTIFEYPHHPHMRMVYADTIVGEQVKDHEQIQELKKDRTNFFLWENFVLYMPRLPKGAEERKKLRMIYFERPAAQLEGHPCVEKSALGTPSIEGDTLVKELLSRRSDGPNVGTCLVGFDLKTK